MKKVYLRSVLRNVAPRFSKAIWQKQEIGHYFSSVKEMSKMYNVRNCNYDVENEEGELIRSVNNAKLDGYGKRYN